MSTQVRILIDGTIEFIGESNELTGSLVSTSPLPRRASSIEPVNPLLRVAFHSIRRIANDTSRLAGWTRRWPVSWRVRIHGGPILPGTYRDRQAAISDEINWLEQNEWR